MARDNDSAHEERSHTHEIDAAERPSEAVIAAVADATDQSPLEMDLLSDAINPDALNRLLGTADRNGSPPRVIFEYCQRQVTATPTAIRVA